MEAADDSRKHWASLLAGKGNLLTLALGTWVGLAASALGVDPSSAAWTSRQGSTRSALDDGATDSAPQPGNAFDWAAALNPMLNSWTGAVDNLQTSAWSWLAPPADNPLARMLGHPAAVVGSENSQGRLSLQAAMALVDLLHGAAAHQALQTQGWMSALQRFMAEFLPTGDESEPVKVTSLDGLVTHWGIVGEATLQEHSRSEPFLRSQAQMLSKAMRYRVASRRVIEAASRANDLPTLTDLDEAFASIHALRGEIRGVRRLAEDAASAAAAAQASAAVSTAKTKSGAAAHATAAISKAKSKTGARRARSAA